MSGSVCPTHGLSSCKITNIYQPFDSETNEVYDDPYMLSASWECKKCNRKGLANLKSIYDTISEPNFHFIGPTYKEMRNAISKEIAIDTIDEDIPALISLGRENSPSNPPKTTKN